jgi:hydrogenase/urease accessory protein HupE
MLAKSKEAEVTADKRFDDGREAGDNGDEFSLGSVIFTVALFFSGVGLVFKTRVRWAFLVAGLFVLLAGVAYVFHTPWA